MFAETVEFNVLHYNHFIEIDGEESPIHHFVEISLVAAGEVFHGALPALGSSRQTLARRIFAQHTKHVRHAAGDLASVRGHFYDCFWFHFVSSSKLFLAVSEMRTRASRAGKVHCRWSMASIVEARFSVVATWPCSSG